MASRKIHAPIALGDKIGKWLVLSSGEKRGKHHTLRCRCECGIERDVMTFTLKERTSLSCRACRPVKKGGKPALKHGMCYSPEYHAWNGMRFRCGNPSDPDYSSYGGRGIRVCERWLNSFDDFYRDMGPKPSPSHSLDRINVDGNYDPKNCRWATDSQQRRNKRTTLMIETDRGTISLAEAVENAGMDYGKVHRRIFQLGWTVTEALSLPSQRRGTRANQ